MELTNPEPRRRRYLGGPVLESRSVRLKSITPILGGAPVPRMVDKVDFIRAPTIRGHLRFWWRALHAHLCTSAPELARRERELWGGAGGDEGTRSQVEIRVEVDQTTVHEVESRVDPRRLGEDAYYALWPARATRNGAPDAERLMPELCFSLWLSAPEARIHEVENALRAWVLWGGYGGRTRRGVGSLTVVGEDAAKWLPRSARAEDLRQVFGGLPLLGEPPPVGARNVPVLQGASLYHGRPGQRPEEVWLKALHWLRDFRQGQSSEQDSRAVSWRAREKGDGGRPGRSRWPEPDKIRQLSEPTRGGRWAHVPRAGYSKQAAWPRAGFGLPLAIRFQRFARARPGEARGRPYEHDEPEDIELRWHHRGEPHDRLASPLIVKAMPLAGGSFAPVALWLCRAWPEGEVVPVRNRVPIVKGSAPFERFMAPGDTPLYAPLQASSLREAFFGWLVKTFSDVKES